MTGLEIIHEVRDILTAGAAIVAGIKAWLANNKAKRIEKDVSDIKITLAQQQMQKQSQNITVNVGTASTSGGAKTEAVVTLSEEQPPQGG
jgi:dihydroxyacetone kinase-like predicted kinase